MSYVVHFHRPRFGFEQGRFRELIGFGKWILGSNILIFLLTQGDDTLVGKVLGVSALGLYQLAYRFSNLPATELTHVISQVTFPVYSKLQGNLVQLREAYFKGLQVTAFISIPLAAMIFVLAPSFTKVFLGDKWMPMVPAMRILCFFGITRSFGATIGSLFQGVGKPDILTKLAVLQLTMLAGIIYPLTTKWGISGTSVAVVVPNLITQALAARKLMKIIEVRALDILRLLAAPIVGALSMILGLWFTCYAANSMFGFLGSVLLGLFVYLTIMFIMDKKFDLGYKAIIDQLRGIV